MPLGPKPHADHVRSRAGLAHGEGADVLARDQLGQPAAALSAVAAATDLIDTQVRVGTVAQAYRGRRTADLFHRHDVLEIAHAGAAQLRFDGDPEQAQLAHLAPQVGGEFVVPVDRLGPRRDLAGGEIGHRIAKRMNGLAKTEVERRQPVGERHNEDSIGSRAKSEVHSRSVTEGAMRPAPGRLKNRRRR